MGKLGQEPERPVDKLWSLGQTGADSCWRSSGNKGAKRLDGFDYPQRFRSTRRNRCEVRSIQVVEVGCAARNCPGLAMTRSPRIARCACLLWIIRGHSDCCSTFFRPLTTTSALLFPQRLRGRSLTLHRQRVVRGADFLRGQQSKTNSLDESREDFVQ